jgi:hypothetical protein
MMLVFFINLIRLSTDEPITTIFREHSIIGNEACDDKSSARSRAL